MVSRTIALVEDHALISLGFRDLVAQVDDLTLMAMVETVADLAHLRDRLDLVVLDLRLADGSSPAENVATIHDLGAHVLVYTGADDRTLIQAAARAGALGLVRKSSGPSALLEAVRTAALGRAVFGADWAAAIDADSELVDAGLSEREQEVLGMYASGETAASVARQLGLSRETVSDYVNRIRRKYARVGRPAHSRVDLFRRALEDGLIE